MPETPYWIGIDLGTSNSCLAFISQKKKGKKPKIFPLLQSLSGNETLSLEVLPSFLYFPPSFEKTTARYALPWNNAPEYVVGAAAYQQGIHTPNRVIHSAKSWLCHRNVDRKAPILPWGVGCDFPKLSPLQVSSAYLLHLKEAWNFAHRDEKGARLEDQNIVLTLPASFDDVARELTLEAAHYAGLVHLTLLEEPMAAFYHWISRYEGKWPKQLKENALVLVCDIGGGTTDFSLIEVQHSEKTSSLEFKRVAVGDHLMLGGNNMDLALAIALEKEQSKRKLDMTELSTLAAHCAQGKEKLLADFAPEKVEFSLFQRGSSVVAKSLPFSLSASTVKETLLEGFFPKIPWENSELPVAVRGLKELGLPYAQDPAITRHLLHFLKRHLSPQSPCLDFVLFNGGALIPSLFTERILEQLNQWFPQRKTPIVALSNTQLDTAVALGAAYFNCARFGSAPRISGGSPRSYYLGIQSSTDPSNTKENKENKAVCLLPFGAEPDQNYSLTQHLFEALVQEWVAFTLYSSTSRKDDPVGELLPLPCEDLIEVAPVQTLLKTKNRKSKRKQIPVHVETFLNETGLLELWLLDRESPRRWQLKWKIGGGGGGGGRSGSGASAEAKADEPETSWKPFPREAVEDCLQKTFTSRALWLPEHLGSHLEDALGFSKDLWDIPTTRAVWDLLWPYASQRSLSIAHEIRWINLAGFCLRPGVGARGDEERLKRMWFLGQEKFAFPRNTQVWVEWWILWRRLSPGLGMSQQTELYHKVSLLRKELKEKHPTSPQETAEKWRLLATLERLTPALRSELGEFLLKQVEKKTPLSYEFWALGRLGSRVPCYAKINSVLAPSVISPWIERLCALPQSSLELCYALAQMAQVTGDRGLDISEELRQKVLHFLEKATHSSKPSEIQALRVLKQRLGEEGTTILPESLQQHYWGEALPPGLILLPSSS
jgi:hypothetical protein